MKLVVDANVLFAVLIKKGVTEDLMLFGKSKLFAPVFLFEEFEKYKDLVLEKTERSEQEFEVLLKILRKRIKLYSRESLGDFVDEAKEICPDENDVEYFALALKLNCGIWSNDRRLREQKEVKIYSTDDLAGEFGV